MFFAFLVLHPVFGPATILTPPITAVGTVPKTRDGPVENTGPGPLLIHIPKSDELPMATPLRLLMAITGIPCSTLRMAEVPVLVLRRMPQATPLALTPISGPDVIMAIVPRLILP